MSPFPSSSLSGTLPSSIGNFGSITYMSFFINKIGGTIQSTISGLRSLQTLDLDTNSLVGTIPSTMSALTSLRYLLLHSNSLVGTIPSTMSVLTSLQYLWFNSNSLVGTIPSTMSVLISLQSLSLYSNSLSGTIPSTMSVLTSLQTLYLNINYLTMGGATSVPLSTFSSTTLSSNIDLDDNCLVFDTTSPYPYRHVTATHCRSTGKYEVWCQNFQYSIVIISLVISELISFMYCMLQTEDRTIWLYECMSLRRSYKCISNIDNNY